MNDAYLLEQLVKAGRLMRTSQRAYYALRGPVKDSPVKQGLLAEAQRREQDFDKLLREIQKVHPVEQED